MVKMKITAVNAPKGTMAVMWNDDPKLEWNYEIPFGDDGLPLQGEQLHMKLIMQIHGLLKAQERVNATDFSYFDSELGKEYDLTTLFEEYDEIKSRA